MTTHKPAAWAALGQAVHEARKEKGLGKTRDWAATVGRSERTLLELERGGKVGTSTLEDVEDALGWPRAGAYRVLNGLPWRDLVTREKEPAASPDLVAAIERIERRLIDIERRLGKAGQEHGNSSAEKIDGGASVTRLTPRPDSSDLDETLDPAADDVRPDDDEEPGGSDDHV